MIPKNLTEEDILKAIQEVDVGGIPSKCHSTQWSLLHDSKYYLPKYLVSIANNFRNGEEWGLDDSSGGSEANQLGLRR